MTIFIDKTRSVRRALVAVSGTLGVISALIAVGTQPAMAASDPCNSGGFVRVATGDMGSAVIPTSGYSINYSTANQRHFAGVQSADHQMQWELGWAGGSAGIARFCAKNDAAIGRNALVIGWLTKNPNGPNCDSQGFADVDLPAGSGWTALASSQACGINLNPGGSYLIEFAEQWANHSRFAESNVTLNRGG